MDNLKTICQRVAWLNAVYLILNGGMFILHLMLGNGWGLIASAVGFIVVWLATFFQVRTVIKRTAEELSLPPNTVAKRLIEELQG